MAPRDIKGNPVDPAPKDIIHLIKLKYWDGAAEQEVLLTDAIDDFTFDFGGGAGPETFQGTGLLLSIGTVSESPDLDAPGVDIAFDGVSQTIISVIANNQFRGRPITIWRVWLDPDTGDIASPGTAPVMMFDGFQNEPYTISESFSGNPDTVTVSTRAVGSLVTTTRNRAVKSNPVSHNEMLESAGVATGDTFFRHVATLQNKEVYWGRDEPDSRVPNVQPYPINY